MVRSPAGTKAKVAELKRPNIHIVQGDLNDYTSLESAVVATSKITGGSLDYLIANAALVKVTNNEFKPFSVQCVSPNSVLQSPNKVF
jgi:NAD(P)-dependent dehydrogenase (short-subunit alcohol dehydrogenase family)